MDYRSSTGRYILTVLAIILLITTFILVGLNAFNLQGRFVTGKSYADGFRAARQMYSRLCPNVATGSKTISGVVVSVSGNGLVLRQDSFDTNEEVDGVSDTRSIELASGAKVFRYAQKSSEQMRKDQEDFTANQQSGNGSIIPPTPFLEQSVPLSEIQAGQHVTVTSDSDIRLAEEITATSVVLQ